MAAPIRNLGDAEPGQASATPPAVRNRLAIRVFAKASSTLKGKGRRGRRG